jgi:hypothetical protein
VVVVDRAQMRVMCRKEVGALPLPSRAYHNTAFPDLGPSNHPDVVPRMTVPSLCGPASCALVLRAGQAHYARQVHLKGLL